MKRAEALGHVLHLSRVWGSQHGGSLYSKAMVQELVKTGWAVTLLAEKFEDTNGVDKRVHLRGFFRRNVCAWPRRARDILQLFLLAWRTSGALVIVQGDLPRLTYVVLQLIVPVIFIRQDGILTCPGNNRFLPRSRSVCKRPTGLACLAIHRVEGCLGELARNKQIGRLALRIRDRLLLRWIRHFVTNSRYLERAHRKPARILFPPLLTMTRDEQTQARRDLHELVFCGRLEKVKGAADAITILSLLPGSYRLSVLGEGDNRGQLERLAEDLAIGSRVRFLGWVVGVTRDRLLGGAGALLMPSLWDEAFGMAGIEAMAQGTPVVAYNVGGISEWCQKGAGVLIKCGDVRAAASAVRLLTEDRARWLAYSQAARRVVDFQFPAARFGRDLREIVGEVMQHQRNRRPGFVTRTANWIAQNRTL